MRPYLLDRNGPPARCVVWIVALSPCRPHRSRQFMARYVFISILANRAIHHLRDVGLVLLKCHMTKACLLRAFPKPLDGPRGRTIAGEAVDSPSHEAPAGSKRPGPAKQAITLGGWGGGWGAGGGDQRCLADHMWPSQARPATSGAPSRRSPLRPVLAPVRPGVGFDDPTPSANHAAARTPAPEPRRPIGRPAAPLRGGTAPRTAGALFWPVGTPCDLGLYLSDIDWWRGGSTAFNSSMRAFRPRS